MISEERYEKFCKKRENIEKEIERVKKLTIKATDEVNNILREKGTNEITGGTKLSDLLKRTELSYKDFENVDISRPELTEEEQEEVEIQVKYEGYINLQNQQVEKFKKLENKLLPKEIDYSEIKGLCLEARQKLNKIKPVSVGQASRISGVSPADISVLLIYLEQLKREEK